MAKLNAYYGLCPLVDYKHFIGISRDAEHGHVVITQSKNIAIKYKLSDQKQIQSWRTRDKFTSPVIYDKGKDKYVAIFDQNTLRFWTSVDTENLDKIKKYKVAKAMYTIINISDNSYVIFKNGNIMTLQSTLTERKNLEMSSIIDLDNENIIDVKYIAVGDIVYISLIVKTKTTINCLLTSFPNGFPQSAYHKIELKRENLSLVGYTFCFMYSKYLYFLSLWSDGELYSYLVAGPSNQELECNYKEQFGSVYGSIESVSCKQDVAMVSIASDHIAIYGADSNQEGACVLIYNTQFKITQSKQTFKMFSNITKIWSVDNVLLLCSGQHLAVIPFEVNTEQLSQLVGSHKIDISDTDVQQIFTVEKWDIDEENDYSTLIPSKIRECVLNCLRQGLSETATCQVLVLTYIENADTEAIESCLNYFRDISEESLVKIIAYLVDNHLSYDNQTPTKNYLIDKVLSMPFTNLLLLPQIKGNCSVNIALHLLKYISFLFSTEHCLPGLDCVETQGKLIEWACLLIDGNYQKFLLTRDEVVQETLNNFSELVNQHLLGLNDLQNAEAVINNFVKRKYISGREQNIVDYCIEEIKLY